MNLQIYKQLSHRDKWRNYKINKGLRKSDHKELIANKGSGYIYIIENTELQGWFKLGMTKHNNIKQRLVSYKSIMPIGQWNIVHWIYSKDVALDELVLKQFYKYECEYETGVNSNEWYKGTPVLPDEIYEYKNIVEYKPKFEWNGSN